MATVEYAQHVERAATLADSNATSNRRIEIDAEGLGGDRGEG